MKTVGKINLDRTFKHRIYSEDGSRYWDIEVKAGTYDITAITNDDGVVYDYVIPVIGECVGSDKAAGAKNLDYIPLDTDIGKYFAAAITYDPDSAKNDPRIEWEE